MGGPKSSVLLSPLWILFLLHILAFLLIYAFVLLSSLHAYFHIPLSFSCIRATDHFFKKKKKGGGAVMAAGGCIIEGL